MKFTAAIIAIVAALGATVDAAAKRPTCDAKRYQFFASQVNNPAYFMKWWKLVPNRTISPVKGITIRQMYNLADCFIYNSPRVRGPYAPLNPGPVPATCDRTEYRALVVQYRDVAQFCKLFNNRPRDRSPIPSIPNPRVVRKACECFVNKRFPEQQSTTTPETTPAATTTVRSSSVVPTTTTTSDLVSTTSSLIVLPTTTTTTSSRTTTTSANTTTFSTATTTSARPTGTTSTSTGM